MHATTRHLSLKCRADSVEISSTFIWQELWSWLLRFLKNYKMLYIFVQLTWNFINSIFRLSATNNPNWFLKYPKLSPQWIKMFDDKDSYSHAKFKNSKFNENIQNYMSKYTFLTIFVLICTIAWQCTINFSCVTLQVAQWGCALALVCRIMSSSPGWCGVLGTPCQVSWRSHFSNAPDSWSIR